MVVAVVAGALAHGLRHHDAGRSAAHRAPRRGGGGRRRAARARHLAPQARLNVPRTPRGVVPVAPGPGQESVWDYPRPPRLERTDAHVVVVLGGVTVVDTRRALRVLESSHPPTIYIPSADIAPGCIQPGAGRSYCEWKGSALYWDVVIGDRVLSRVGWSYPNPTPTFEMLRDHIAFYAAPFDRCLIDGETVTPQPGTFYGGWITADLCGPFKGVPGSMSW